VRCPESILRTKAAIQRCAKAFDRRRDLMIRPRGRLVLCFVLLIGWTCGVLELLRSEPMSGNPPSQPVPPRAAQVRIPQDPKDVSPRKINAEVVHVYEFTLKPGDYIHFVVDQDGVDVKAELFDEGGQFLFDVDGLNGRNGPEDVPLLATEATTFFRVEISTEEGKGAYRVGSKDRRRATEKERAWFEGARAYSRGRHGGSFSERVTSFQEAAQFWERAGHTLGRADALQKLGKLHKENPETKGEAPPFYLEALPLYQRLGSRQEAIVQNDLGLIYSDLGRPELAEGYYRGALASAIRLGDLREKATALKNLCSLDSGRAEFSSALASCEEALSLLKGLKIVAEQARVLNLMGQLYVGMGQVNKGLEYHKKALTLSGEGELKASTLTHVGDAYYQSDSLPLAILYYKKALRIQRDLKDRTTEAVTLNNLALAYYHSKNYRGALAALQRAISLFEEQKTSRWKVAGLVNLGWVLDKLDQPREAVRIYGQALKLAREMSYPEVKASALFGMAWSERNQGNPRAAQELVKQAIAVVESQLESIDQKELRATFIAGRQNFYDLLVQLQMEQHQLQRSGGHDILAFEASEGARARSLHETLSGRLNPPRLSLQEIQQGILDSDTVLLEYFLGDPNSYLFVVTSTGITTYTLASETVLTGLAWKVRRLLPESYKREHQQEAVRNAQELSRLLLGQVAGRLGNKRLLVVAPPALQYVSFSALPNPVVAVKPGEVWPEPMMERHEILPIPAVSILKPLRRARVDPVERSGLLAMLSDPVTSSRDDRLRGVSPTPLPEPELGSMERLQYADDEAEKIVELFPPGSYFKATGFDVRRDLVLSGQLKSYAILHFATHGYLNPRNAGFSGLVLSQYDRQGQRIDGLLSARDIEKLNLSADLVVLSACGTALGQEVRGEGLVGLTHAFFSAGVPRVIVSLWDVDDRSTAELMAIFYSNLQKDGLPPSEALRKAQLTLRKMPGRSAPSFWAGFVLQGDWQPLR
jgi:CHAT domain-containing protein/Tfp pilus assembly protein PilF